MSTSFVVIVDDSAYIVYAESHSKAITEVMKDFNKRDTIVRDVKVYHAIVLE